MNLGFVFTNYNNSHFTREAIQSLSLNINWTGCYIVIVDNNSEQVDIQQLEEIKKDYPKIHLLFNETNLGYFKGLNVGIEYLRSLPKKIEHIIIGNNDLYFPKDFLSSVLNALGRFERYAVISPNIVTLDGCHQNPHVVKSISKYREVVYDLYFLNYHLALIIKQIARVTNRFTDRKDEKQHEIGQPIYQGCGACYILGPVFFKHFDSLWAPTFLMGEEFFLSWQLSSRNLKIYYEPSVILHHHCHATIHKLPNRRFWEISRDSHKVYRKYIKIWK